MSVHLQLSCQTSFIQAEAFPHLGGFHFIFDLDLGLQVDASKAC